MFNFKNKLDYNLQLSLNSNVYKKYRVFVKCKNLFSSVLKKISSMNDALIYPIKPCNLISCNLSKREIIAISEYPEVESIYFDEYLFLCGMSVSNANNYHKLTSKLKFSGKGVTIGIVDSGVYPHIDLTRPNNKIEHFEDVISHKKFPYDDNGHGTALAGIICGSGVSSNNMCTGIAPQSSIVCYKAFDALGKGYASDILFSICQLVDKSEEFNIKVLCLPFEMLSNNHRIFNSFNNIFDYALSKNIIPVVPSGSINNSEFGMMGIALLKNCITVAGMSTVKESKPYMYSSKSLYSKLKKPNFACACDQISTLNSDTSYISEKNGVKVYPRNIDAKYKSYSGTSLSVAFVCAICAILFEYDPTLKLDDIISLINLSCSNFKEYDKDLVGSGIINLNRLLEK